MRARPMKALCSIIKVIKIDAKIQKIFDICK